METTLLTKDVLTLDLSTKMSICLTWKNTSKSETSCLCMQLRVVLLHEEIEKVLQSKLDNEEHHLKLMQVTQELKELQLKKLDTQSTISSMKQRLSELTSRLALTTITRDMLKTDIDNSMIELSKVSIEENATSDAIESMTNTWNALSIKRRQMRCNVTEKKSSMYELDVKGSVIE